MPVKVRIAPSPTGNLHFGNARTALFNWLFAKKHGGQLILRIEDTDLERSDKKYEESIINSLRWLGIQWDGEIVRQSQRLTVYTQYLKELLASGKAFWCHHTVKELDAEKKGQMERKEAPRHLCDHKNSEKGKETGEIIRLVVDQTEEKKLSFDDAIRGTIEFNQRVISDVSLAKDLQTPLYNFAVVIDDIDMAITHVIRGEDHISNTPKQMLIYQALGKTPPIFAHLPLILGSDKSKLSKRHGALDIMDYAKDYLPEALVNFMGFLGHTYSKDILSKEEMAKEFELAKVHKSGAIFNIQKLNWINAQYVRQLAPSDFEKLIGHNVLKAAIPLMTERLEKLTDMDAFHYFWEAPSYEAELLIWKSSSREDVKKSLEASHALLEKLELNNKDELRKELDKLSAGQAGNRGLVYWPLRVALTGEKMSPDPVDIISALDKEEVLSRVRSAINKLS
ncbi:MAG: glutamate--tRNA ligase [Patescibacteria group bacterium]